MLMQNKVDLSMPIFKETTRRAKTRGSRGKERSVDGFLIAPRCLGFLEINLWQVYKMVMDSTLSVKVSA